MEPKWEVRDTQSAWLLLSFCAAARANSFLRAVNPDFTDQFAASHDDGVWQCLCRILKIHPTCGAWEQSSLPLWKGGLGLRSARRTQPAAHWASWADALKMVHERHPGVAETMVGALEASEESSSIQAVLRCARVLEDAGFERPSWADLLEGRSPGRVSDDEDPCQPRAGWQQKAGSVLEHHHHDHVVWPRLREPEQALMRSQRGPLASVAFTSTPSDRCSRFDPALFRVLLLRRLLLPLPLSVRNCRCGRPLDAFGTTVQLAQQQGCWGAEVGLWSLSWPECAGRAEQESAPTFSCATWTWHSTTAWMADDWKWWQMGCPSTEAPSWPSTRQWCHHCTGMAVPDEAQLPMTGAHVRNEPALSLPVRGAGRVLLCWLLKSGAAGQKKQRSSSHHSPGPKSVNSPRTSNATVAGHGSEGGKSCWPAQPRRLSPCLSSTSHPAVPMVRSFRCTR